MYVYLLLNTLQLLLVGVGKVTVTIDILTDVALLEIFDYYMDQVREEEDDALTAEAWYTLVHVCLNWRSVVFGSPRRLNLRLFCTSKTPVRETLAVWPLLHIVIGQCSQPTDWQMDNIIMVLEHKDRICQIDLFHVTEFAIGKGVDSDAGPIPGADRIGNLVGKLAERRNATSEDEPPPVVPDSFLGGSATFTAFHFRNYFCLPLALSVFPFVKFLIPDIISPEAMVHCLSALMRLERLSIGFESPLSLPTRERRLLHWHPPTRSALPALIRFRFEGVSEYLEDLVTRVDAPLLDSLDVRFFHQLIFDSPQLAQFVARTPNIQPHVEARIDFFDDCVEVTSSRTFPRKFVLGIKCRQSDWQLSSLVQICGSSFPEAFISTMDHLYISGWSPRWQDDIEDSQWLEVLHPFTAVKHLYLSRKFVSRIAPALQELAGEVLPSLQKLFLEESYPSGPVQGAIGKFVAARQLAGHPIVVSPWDGYSKRVIGEG
jgi:hypothetical protein